MVVDDTEDLLELTRRLLESRGYEVIALPDSSQAMEVIRKEQPDLILLDMLMPGPSGEEVCQLIRKEPSTRHIPVIITTGQLIEPDTDAAIGPCANGYLKKPFEPDEMIKQIEGFLPR